MIAAKTSQTGAWFLEAKAIYRKVFYGASESTYPRFVGVIISKLKISGGWVFFIGHK